MKWLRAITNMALAGLVVAALMVVGPADAGHLTMHRHSRAERLLVEHGCWQGAAPKDVDFPGHVVLTTRDGRTIYGGKAYVGNALDQVFAGKPHGYKVWGFCR